MRARLGAGLALAAQQALRQRPPGGAERWTRTNHRGRSVSLLSGPALAVGAGLTAHAPGSLVAGLGAAAVGAYDDLVGGAGAKGFRGHLTSLARGELTTGTAKIGGLAAVGALAALRHRPDVLLGGAVVAGTANLLNLLDLRPGRALKAGGVMALALGEPGVAGACAGLLPGDLRERTMLGDTGANALGAVLGVALLHRLPGRRSKLAALGVLAGLTAASEVVSYSAVIDRNPLLHRLDQLGRLP